MIFEVEHILCTLYLTSSIHKKKIKILTYRDNTLKTLSFLKCIFNFRAPLNE